MKRWVALVIGIVSLAAGFVELRRMAERRAPVRESISERSRAQLDDVIRRSARP